MPHITIDGTDYDLATLSDDAKAQIASLAAVDRRIALLQEELAIHHTARNAYASALKALLPGGGQGHAVKSAAPSAQISWPDKD